MSVHFCLCRVGLHPCHSVSVHFCLCRVGLHTCHSVSPLLSLSPWSSHLPQCHPTASSRFSVTVRVVIPTATLNESIVNGYRRHSHNSCSRLLPQGLNPANPQVKHVSPVTTTTSSRASLFELNVTVPHVLFSASARPTGQLEGRGAEVTDLASLRLAGQCWLLRLIVLARAGP